MLIKITLDNFKSFKNKTTVDLTKTNYTTLPQNVADNDILKGCIFVGANASGKSTLILGVKLLLDFLFSEMNLNSGIFLCMFGNTPCYSLSYEFLIDEKIVKYFFEVDTGKDMLSEKLWLNDTLMLERMGLSAKSYIAKKNGVNYDETDIDKDTLFLRTLYFNTKFACNSVLSAWMDYLKSSIYINLFDKTIISYGKAELSVARYLDKSGCESINRFFDEYNFEQNIEYDYSGKGGNIHLIFDEEDSIKSILFKHNGIEIPIPFSEESLGNQNLLRILPAFLTVIQNGGMLLIDDFSIGFHSELQNLMVRYFMEKSGYAQILFVSHSTNLLSNSILRPDQEYSVEFQIGNGSSVKRFSSEQPRSTQNIEKMYVSGVFGGLPKYKEANDEAK